MKIKLKPVLLRSVPFAGILGVGAAAFVLLSSLRQPPAAAEAKSRVPLVEICSAKPAASNLVFEVDGEVSPYRQISLASEVAGRVIRKSPECKAGRFVQQGTLLLRIDSRDYELEIDRLQSQVQQAGISIEELDVELSNADRLIALAEKDLELAERDLQRFVDLSERRASSDAQLDAARKELLRSRNSLQTLENQRQLLQTRRGRLFSERDQLTAQLKKATLNRERTEIVAPIDGVITADLVEQDDFVQPGTGLVQLEDTSKIEVRFNLKLRQLRWIWSPDLSLQQLAHRGVSYQLPEIPLQVALKLDDATYVWQGKLLRYDGAGISPATRTVPCVALVDDPQGGSLDGTSAVSSLPAPPTLLRGMFVTLRIPVPTELDLLEFPVEALRPGDRVWVLTADNQLSTRTVSVAQIQTDRVLVLTSDSQLRTGEQVITSPLALAVDGMQLRRWEVLAASAQGGEER